MNNIEKTLEMEKYLKAKFDFKTEKDKKILSFLTLASNTLSIVEAAAKKSSNIACFYENLFVESAKRNMYPYFLNRILHFYVDENNCHRSDYWALHSYYCCSVFNDNRQPIANPDYKAPVLNGGLIKIRFDGIWHIAVKVAFTDSKEINESTRRFLQEEFDSVIYRLEGMCELEVGSEKIKILNGNYQFHYGHGWLIVEKLEDYIS